MHPPPQTRVWGIPLGAEAAAAPWGWARAPGLLGEGPPPPRLGAWFRDGLQGGSSGDAVGM